MQPAAVTLVIPTFNERPNVEPLLDQIRGALGAYAWEALFVDDSTDGTDAVIAGIAAADPRVRLLHRPENRGGLAGAVVEGMRAARGTYICVLDADLQHPPSRIPALLEEAERSSAGVVIASRYTRGGSAGGLDGPGRHLASQGLRILSKLAFPVRLAGVSDPLGGFFLVRRSVVDGVVLRPVGYKILLEILVRCRPRRVREIPYRFQPRLHGDTKASVRQGVWFLRHLGRLAWDCSPGFVLASALLGRARTAWRRAGPSQH